MRRRWTSGAALTLPSSCDFQHNRRIEKSRVFGFAIKYIPVGVTSQANELSVEKSNASVEKVGVSSVSVEKVYDRRMEAQDVVSSKT
jgi:hypothetical protein